METTNAFRVANGLNAKTIDVSLNGVGSHDSALKLSGPILANVHSIIPMEADQDATILSQPVTVYERLAQGIKKRFSRLANAGGPPVFSQDQQWLAQVMDGQLLIWNLAAVDEESEPINLGEIGSTTTPAFTSDSRRLIVGSRDWSWIWPLDAKGLASMVTRAAGRTLEDSTGSIPLGRNP